MSRRPTNWKIVGLGFGILALGIAIMIFWTGWFERENVTNPIGVILTIASILAPPPSAPIRPTSRRVARYTAAVEGGDQRGAGRPRDSAGLTMEIVY